MCNRDSFKIFVILLYIIIYGCAPIRQNASAKVENEQLHLKWINNLRDTSANFTSTVENFKKYISGNNRTNKSTNNQNSFENVDDFFKVLNIIPDQNILNKDNSAFEIKMFKGWYFQNINWLKADGTIMGPKERQLIIENQANQLRIIESKNKIKGNGK